MNNISNTHLASEETKATTVKFTGNQCSEATQKLWKWVGRSNSSAVLILPPYEKSISRPNENPIEVLGYEGMGDICSAGHHVVVEWFDSDEDLDPVYLLFQFEANKLAQAFSKRLHRQKHQVLLAGEDCVRIVKLTPGTKPATDPERGRRGAAAPNIVVHSGRDLTEVELNYYADLPSESFEALVEYLKSGYRRAVREARHMPIITPPVTRSQPAQAEVAHHN